MLTTAVLSTELYHAIKDRVNTKNNEIYKNWIADDIQKRSREGLKGKTLDAAISHDVYNEPTFKSVSSDTIKDLFKYYGLTYMDPVEFNVYVWGEENGKIKTPAKNGVTTEEEKLMWNKNYDRSYQEVNDAAFGKGNLKALSNISSSAKKGNNSNYAITGKRVKSSSSIKHSYDKEINTMNEYNNAELEHAKKGFLRSAAEGLANAGASFHKSMYENDQTRNKKSNVDTRQALADEQLKNAKLQKESKMKRDEEILAALTSSVSQFLRGDNVITSNEDKQIRDILRNTNYVDYVVNPNGRSIVFISKSFPNKTFSL